MSWNEKSVWNLKTLTVIVGSLLVVAGYSQADFDVGEPINLGPVVNSSSFDGFASISADGLELYFSSDRPGGSGDIDIWVTTRASTADPWGEPVNLGTEINSAGWDLSPCLSEDDQTLYFASARPGGEGEDDIWLIRRPTRDGAWGAPENLGQPINTPTSESFVAVTADGLQLFYGDWGTDLPGGQGGRDLWMSTRASVSDPWGIPANMGPTVNSSAHDEMLSVSHDGLILFLTSRRPGGQGGRDIWLTRRATIEDSWTEPVNMGPSINTSQFDQTPAVSADGTVLYFSLVNLDSIARPGGYGNGDLWRASINPVVDFNGDYHVNIEDLVVLIEHWGQSEPVYDMGPMPWGDGVVDRADLEVLMSYWGQEPYDPHLLAHWKLDEAEGDIAYGSITDNDGAIIGKAVWQPDNGQIEGALQCDGTTTYVDAPFILNPEDGPLSVFAWINGGASGQVIISQSQGMDWLAVDAEQGFLKTNLTSDIRGMPGPPLDSSAVITDGNWHRVGLVWDGTNRILYVDDVEVARDVLDNLAPSDGGLTIGVGSGLEDGTFWSGMIDDVRIYNRVVIP